MKLLNIIALFILWLPVQAQYYYTDILARQQSDKQYALLLKNNIKSVTASSFDADGSETEGFLLQQDIDAAHAQIKTISALAAEGQSASVSHYKDGRIVHTTISGDNIFTEINYEYDEAYNVTKIFTVIMDTFMKSRSEEMHQWIYASRKPVRMFLIKNGTDTTIAEFQEDKSGDFFTETWKRKGMVTERYYYYHNKLMQVTDIVRFNLKAQRMLPDYVFEYDNAGKIISTIQVPQGSADYLTWNYFYNNGGLKTKELCFNKQKQLQGSIEYQYQ